ncbi:hypothetical protein LINGRAHAP2_LOCUS32169 [Linum grandiflorum]
MWKCGLGFEGIYSSYLSRLVFHRLSLCSLSLLNCIYYIQSSLAGAFSLKL